MSIAVTFNGTSYSLPSPGDVEYVDALNTFLRAIAGAAATSGTIAVSITVASGRALTVQGDITSPALAALRIVPQDTQPSGPNLVGDTYLTTAGVWKTCTVAGSPGTWQSIGAQT